MFKITGGKAILITRGDVANIAVNAVDSEGKPYTFVAGDVIRFMVFKKSSCSSVVIHKRVEVSEETTNVLICLNREDTKIGEPFNSPREYWYEVELNPDTTPQTLVGYDEEGPKIFRLYPEGVLIDE